MTAELHGEIPLLSPIQDWTYAEQPGPDLFVVVHELEGAAYREVRAGEDLEVTVPFPVRLRPADSFGPRRKC